MVQIWFEIIWIRFIIGIGLYGFLVELELNYYWDKLLNRIALLLINVNEIELNEPN